MKSGAESEKRRGASAPPDASPGRRKGSGQQLEQRRLASAVVADDAERASLLNLEPEVAQRPERLRVIASQEQLLQTVERAAVYPVGLSQALGLQCNHRLQEISAP